MQPIFAVMRWQDIMQTGTVHQESLYGPGPHLSIHTTVNDFELCGNRPGPLICQAPKQACCPESTYGLELVVPDPLPGFCHLQQWSLAVSAVIHCAARSCCGGLQLCHLGQGRAYSAAQYTGFLQKMHMQDEGEGYVQVALWGEVMYAKL